MVGKTLKTEEKVGKNEEKKRKKRRMKNIRKQSGGKYLLKGFKTNLRKNKRERKKIIKKENTKKRN